MYSVGFFHVEHFQYFSERYFFYPFFNGLNQVAQKSSIVPWISPVIGITVGTAEFIEMIGTAIEAGVKGISNLAVGLTTFNTFLLKTGGKQLLVVLKFGANSIPVAIFVVLITTKEMFLRPQEDSKKYAEIYQASIRGFFVRQLVNSLPYIPN